MAEAWDQQQERSNTVMLRLILWIARSLGRPVARLLLFPIVGYFLLTGGSAKKASRDFLRRALNREPRWLDHAKHFHTFASVMLDRMLILSGNKMKLDMQMNQPPEVATAMRSGRGCLLLLAHLGSFEVLRARAVSETDLRIRILMDMASNRMFSTLIQQLDPVFAKSVIDASQRGPTLVLALKEALAEDAVVGTMADRVRDDERAVSVEFLGGTAQLPAGPWILASALNVPVILAFSLYRGGNHYDVQFELVSEKIELPRSSREQALQNYAQRYADCMAHYAKQAPYNWFNFYDYWTKTP
ncbi:LpxL/LpxP family acyltransferase [Stenotrophobium rhamnosiphilum]|uniref:Lipid A biosynthesis acyltransferase n=1 Tax=Stenotrophobium rhamnosiphilum TaxID=2029166 RepID=A0A2T5MFQ5_9GAMM|nr:lipid A biosynthesis acyltransferase [Stenotrophobium rhamnosiphilum]PTU31390.1 lipid A biosynthesis acyltransferase [Stenotrophobium rhamnosiphilum]